MMENKQNPTEYELKQGLFGKTDRNSGEYHFKSGNTQHLYSNASYIPVSEETAVPRYYKYSGNNYSQSGKTDNKKDNRGLIAVACLCLMCALGGGLAGALIMNGVNNAFREESVGTQEVTSSDILSVSSVNTATDDQGSVSKASFTASGENSYTMSAKDIYSNCCDQVLSVNTEKYSTSRNGETVPNTISGTGFYITDNGYILTNYHVVEEAYRYNYPVTLTNSSNDTYSGTVVGVDETLDVAVLKVNNENCPYATLGDSSQIVVGEDIYIIGNPYGVLDFTFTSGHVGGPIRQIDSSGNGYAIDMFQLDADIYEGNSGGPVYNDRGEVIGIVTAKFSSDSNDGIGFAIPINTARDKANEIISVGYTGGKASLGAEYFDKFNDVMANFYELPAGAFIMNVGSGSAAEKAGFERGDIIVQIGSSAIYDKYNCEDVIGSYKAGDTETFVVYKDRTGNYEYVTVTFDEATAG